MSTEIPIEGVKNLLIDFGGVLIDLDKERCLRAFEKIGVRGLENFLEDCHQRGFLNDFECGRITVSEFCTHMREKACVKGASPTDEEILAAWNHFLVGIPAYKLELLLRLRRHYRLLLLSNTNQAHWAWSCAQDFSWEGHRVEDFFDTIYLSFELHVEKPRPEIFERIIADSGISSEETLFIDDSALNCEIGRSFGLRTYTSKPLEDWNKALRLKVD